MLDRKFIVANADAVKENCKNRNVICDVDKLLSMEERRREILQQVEEHNRAANAVSKTIGQAKDDEERNARKEEGRRLRDLKDEAQKEHDQLDAEIRAIQITIPNMAHPDAPIGDDDKANPVSYTHLTLPTILLV